MGFEKNRRNYQKNLCFLVQRGSGAGFRVALHRVVSIEEEVEIDARLIEQGENGEGKLSAVLVEVRKKEGGRMVALGRQWMASTRPDKHRRSNL